MTHNQIEYWSLKEDQRHNRAVETETNRQNVAVLEETKRHNVASENFNLSSLAETTRHNKATETETQRHNIAGEKEVQRHNVATEQFNLSALAETSRHNKASEGLQAQANTEAARHNVAVESETYRSNVFSENIIAQRDRWNHEYNMATTAIGQVRNELQRKELEQQLQKIRNDYEIGMTRNNIEAVNTAVGSVKDIAATAAMSK